MNNFNYRKATQTINFFINKEGGSINKLKLMKLVWLSDRLHIRKFGRTISGDNYFAMKNGPVASKTLDLIKANSIVFSDEEIHYSSKYISETNAVTVISKHEVETSPFSKTDLKVMEEVYSLYCKFNGEELSEISHSFPEWKQYEQKLLSGESKKEAISIEDFFKNIESETYFPNMNDDEEDLALTKELFFSK